MISATMTSTFHHRTFQIAAVVLVVVGVVVSLSADVTAADGQSGSSVAEEERVKFATPLEESIEEWYKTVPMFAESLEEKVTKRVGISTPLFVLRNFMTEQESYQVIDFATKNTRFQTAPKGPSDSTPPRQVAVVAEGGKYSPHSLLIASIQKRMATKLGVTVRHFEPMLVARYEIGQSFALHTDFLDGERYADGQQQRGFSFLCFLNSLDSGKHGGQSQWPAINPAIALQPKVGLCVSWPSSSSDGRVQLQQQVHEELEVTSGSSMKVTNSDGSAASGKSGDGTPAAVKYVLYAWTTVGEYRTGDGETADTGSSGGDDDYPGQAYDDAQKPEEVVLNKKGKPKRGKPKKSEL
jgi:hypothetical protein